MRLLAAVLVCLFAISCGRTEAVSEGSATSSPASSPAGTAAPSPAPGQTFAPGKVLIDTAEGSVLIDVEKAETPEQRAQGLMFRESLPRDEGMVFLFFEESTGGFYMKNTKIPLSIAFFDTEGRIVSIRDMEPCKADPCKIYHPVDASGRTATYVGALEVNQGAFEEWGVELGDRITVRH